MEYKKSKGKREERQVFVKGRRAGDRRSAIIKALLGRHNDA